VFSRFRLWWLVQSVAAPFSVDAVYRSIDRHAARLLRRFPRARAVYGYEDGALQTFRAARARGMRTIYELPTPYWRTKEEIGREEAKLQPEWAGTLRFDREGVEKLARKDEELQLADVIVVPSDFVAESLQRAPPRSGRIVVLPYGSPVTGVSAPREAPAGEGSGPLRVIYVGNFGQAKGIAYLIEAIEALEGRVQLTLIGRSPPAPPARLTRFLARHRYFPSLPHGEVLREMREHEVLVLPTLYEGLALVVLEAMGQGLAVVTTPNSGATGIVRDGEEGFIVPIRSAAAIRDRLAWMADRRADLARMRRAALARAGTVTWESYRARFSALVAGVLA